jgi:hypothetical protein
VDTKPDIPSLARARVQLAKRLLDLCPECFDCWVPHTKKAFIQLNYRSLCGDLAWLRSRIMRAGECCGHGCTGSGELGSPGPKGSENPS